MHNKLPVAGRLVQDLIPDRKCAL